MATTRTRSRALTLVVVTGLMVSSCLNATSSTSPPTDVPPIEQSGPTSGLVDPTTPLAVVPAPDRRDSNTSPATGLGEGSIIIGDTCVTWSSTEGQSSTTLLWPDGSVTYDASSNTINYTPSDGDPLTLRNGDRISVRGVPATGTTDFVIVPSFDCPVDALLVHAVTLDG